MGGMNPKKGQKERPRNWPKHRSAEGVKEEQNVGCNNLLGTNGSVKKSFKISKGGMQETTIPKKQ
jgi:hypothetical protein